MRVIRSNWVKFARFVFRNDFHRYVSNNSIGFWILELELDEVHRLGGSDTVAR